MKILRTLGKTTWDKIEVGEVFVLHGCWQIGEKIDKGHIRYLADDGGTFDGNIGKIINTVIIKYGFCAGKELLISKCMKYVNSIYKLPKSTQKLWRQEK